ncbi:MAG TPA: DUF3343 domain-containing protein [Spirochaetota bacterium]|nr:DUF3343 domain-containing protein [Spirochaetota bacterium]HPI90477.1 DUF3343 domain-containing protein [Spirochaetota bacterium]HPR46921.1 DUF3343 domain-containing protein [Spirochaetota bacterium]
METYSAILFHSPNYSIWTAKVLKKAGIENRMIPIPRHLSSDCGYCVRIKRMDADAALEIMKSNAIEYDKIEEI